MRQTTDVLADF